MRCAIVQLHSEGFRPLVELLDPNTDEYCARHGYERVVKVVEEAGIEHAFSRLRGIRSLFRMGEFDVIWCLGCDTIIMNHHIRIEDRMCPGFDFLIAKDCNDVNSDSFLVRNSKWSAGFLDEVLSMEEEYLKTQWLEQGAIADAIAEPHNSKHVKIVPQRHLNSYLYADGLNPEWGQKWIDHPGKFGWGDWLIHLPGLPMGKRIEAVKKYLPKVVK